MTRKGQSRTVWHTGTFGNTLWRHYGG